MMKEIIDDLSSQIKCCVFIIDYFNTVAFLHTISLLSLVSLIRKTIHLIIIYITTLFTI